MSVLIKLQQTDCVFVITPSHKCTTNCNQGHRCKGDEGMICKDIVLEYVARDPRRNKQDCLLWPMLISTVLEQSYIINYRKLCPMVYLAHSDSRQYSINWPISSHHAEGLETIIRCKPNRFPHTGGGSCLCLSVNKHEHMAYLLEQWVGMNLYEHMSQSSNRCWNNLLHRSYWTGVRTRSSHSKLSHITPIISSTIFL